MGGVLCRGGRSRCRRGRLLSRRQDLRGLLGGLCRAPTVGFCVQTAQRIGAGEEKDARNLVRQGLVLGIVFGLVLALVGSAVSGSLPRWLGAEESIWRGASVYFLIFALSLPALQINGLVAALLQASGNMRTPSALLVLMCGLDVVFNLLLIFPSRQIGAVTLPGANLGVAGAALGTALAEVVVAVIMCVCLLRSPMLGLRRDEKLHFVPEQLKRAVRLGIPVAIEQAVMSGGQIVTTGIIAPLGTVSIAANSFAVTAEALCYMPGYGVQTAAVTLIGQSVGAKRRDLVTRLGWVTVLLGVSIMAVMSAAMYFLAPWIIGILSPDAEVVALGTEVLRIVVFAEPLFGAAIVCAGVFQGAGSSLLSSVLNFTSMWGVRITLTLLLTYRLGLRGAWIAMCVELCFRGLLFLFCLWRRVWLAMDLRGTPASAELCQRGPTNGSGLFSFSCHRERKLQRQENHRCHRRGDQQHAHPLVIRLRHLLVLMLVLIADVRPRRAHQAQQRHKVQSDQCHKRHRHPPPVWDSIPKNSRCVKTENLRRLWRLSPIFLRFCQHTGKRKKAAAAPSGAAAAFLRGNYSSSSLSLARSLRSNSSLAPQLGQMTSPSSRTDSSK